MKETLIRANGEIRCSTLHGYGVFATRDIKVGDIIEECPLIFLSEKVEALKNYIFQWVLSETENIFVMPFGLGGLYNHADTPNARYRVDKENELLIFFCEKPILAGEEIVVYYGDKWFASRDMQQRIILRGWRRFVSRRYAAFFIFAMMLAYLYIFPL